MTDVKQFILLVLLATNLLMCSHEVCSQTSIDSLKSEMKISSGTKKVDLLNAISKQYQYKDPDSSMFYASNAETEADVLDYRSGKVAAIKNKGNYFVRIGDFEQAMTEYDRAVILYKELNDQDGLQKILNNMGHAFRVQGDFDQALYYFIESLKISEQEGIKQGIAYASLNIGIIYSTRQEKTDVRGLPYFLRALDICKETQDDKCIAYAINNIALMYLSMDNYDKSLEYFQQSLDLKKAIDDKDGMAVTLGNISDVYTLKGEHETSMKYSRQALDISRELEDERGIIEALLDLGKSSYMLDRYDEGIEYLNEALTLSEESNSLTLLSSSYQYLHELYLSRKNHKRALEYHLLYTNIKDSIYSENSSKQIAEMRTLYDTEKKEAEITQLTSEKKINELQLKKSENMKLFLILASFLTLLLATIAFYAFKQKQKANVFLEERNKFEIESKKKAISLFGQQVSKEVAQELLSDSFNSGSKELFACVMFLDIRNFTVYAENKEPSEIIQYQNDVFGFMIESIDRHHGIINQFLGDGFMATFGAPVSSGNDCQNAVDAALDIYEQLKQLSESGSLPKTEVGIGLHFGKIVTGNVGTAERKQYSITGNTVILASRIEQLNKAYRSKVLISKEVLGHIDTENLKTTHLGKVDVKGRSKPIEIVRLV